MISIRPAVAFVALFSLIACATTPTGRKQVRLLEDEQVVEMGEKSFDEIKKKATVSSHSEKITWVHCVADRLLARNGMNPKEWEVIVFQDPAINAFALPGKKIGVFEGLFKAARNQHQLAAVIGHEIGHVQAHHANERLSQQLLIQGGLSLARIAVNGDTPEGQLILRGLGVGAVFGVALPFSRKHELEADIIGLRVMANAGFEGQQAVRLWQNMADESKTKVPEFLSTHPSSRTRIEQINRELPKLKAIAQNAKRSYGGVSCDH